MDAVVANQNDDLKPTNMRIFVRNVCRQTYIISISNNMVFWCI